MVMSVVLVPMVAEGTMVMSPMVSVLKLVITLSALVGLVIAFVGGSVVGGSVVGGSVVGDSVVGDSVVGGSVVGSSVVGGSVVGDSVVGGSVVGDSVGVSSLNSISAILGVHSALGCLLNVISI